MRDNIQTALSVLINRPLWSIGRSCNLLWLQFGEVHSVRTRSGETKLVGDWALHILCSWRLCQNARILVAERDYYRNNSGECLSDWDEPGKSHFDLVAQILATDFKVAPPVGSSITTDDVGGFSLYLTAGYRLDVFPDEISHGEPVEYWRLFTPHTVSPHFVTSASSESINGFVAEPDE